MQHDATTAHGIQVASGGDEAKNDASETRVVLLFDIWRPELTLEEREEVTKFLGAISTYSGEKIVSGN